MSTFIMLCGQGSIGKSTYGKALSQYISSKGHSVDFIRMDNYTEGFDDEGDKDALKNRVYQDINNSLKINDYVIYDFSNDCAISRKAVLDAINTNGIDFKCFFLTCDLLVFLKRMINRSSKCKDTIELNLLNMILEIYEYAPCHYPCEEEFEDYNFNSVDIKIIDNTKDISEVNFEGVV